MVDERALNRAISISQVNIRPLVKNSRVACSRYGIGEKVAGVTPCDGGAICWLGGNVGNFSRRRLLVVSQDRNR